MGGVSALLPPYGPVWLQRACPVGWAARQAAKAADAALDQVQVWAWAHIGAFQVTDEMILNLNEYIREEGERMARGERRA